MMVKRRPIPLIALAILLCWSAQLSFGDSERSPDSIRTQKILEIQRLIQDHDFVAAQRLIASARKQFPRDAGFDNLLGIIAAQEGNYKQAESSFVRAVQREPKFTGAYLNLGRLYQQTPDADSQTHRKALEVYERILGYDPANSEANYQSAVLLLQKSEYGPSLDHVLRLPADTRNSAQALSVLCADYAGLGNRQMVESTAAQLTAAPDFSEADVQQLLPGLAGKRDDLLVSLLQHLQTRQALSPETLRLLGLACERSGKLPEARAFLEEAAVKKTSVPSLVELARVAHKQHDYQGALGYLAHAEDLDPSNGDLYYAFGFVCLDLNLIAEARNAFEKAVKLDPENASFNYAMGAASAYRHDPAEAVPYFQKYLKLKPQDPRGKLALGAAFFRAKDYTAAEPWLRQALKISQTATTAHYYLGCMALQEHHLEEARTELEQSLKGDPESANTLAELGQYHLVRKDYTEAEKYIQRALQIDPAHYSANFYLLNLYIRAGDARREAQAKRFEELKKVLDEKTKEFLRIVEIRPFEGA